MSEQDLYDESHRSYEEAKASLTPDQQLVGFYKGPQPLYFTMPRTATDEEIEAAVFERTHGRPMSDLDLTIRRLYRQHEHRLDKYRVAS